jgi:hypothetical protein
MRNKYMKYANGLLTVAMAFGIAQGVQAAVIDSADVGGLATFQDTNTGRVWLELDNFFGKTTTEMVAAAQSAGFTFATTADVHQLLDSLPLTGSEWPGYEAIMGGAPNRGLIWGSYDDGGDPLVAGWAYAYDSDSAWNFVDATVGVNDVPNAGGDLADMNIWAYQGGHAVPAPGSLVLALLALAGIGAVGRRRHQ